MRAIKALSSSRLRMVRYLLRSILGLARRFGARGGERDRGERLGSGLAALRPRRGALLPPLRGSVGAAVEPVLSKSVFSPRPASPSGLPPDGGGANTLAPLL